MPTIHEFIQQAAAFVVPTNAVEQVGFVDIAADTTLTTDTNRIGSVDPTAGPFTITLPDVNNVYAGYEVELRNVTGLTTAITISGNGININGSASLVLNTARWVRRIQYIPASGVAAAQYIVIKAVN